MPKFIIPNSPDNWRPNPNVLRRLEARRWNLALSQIGCVKELDHNGRSHPPRTRLPASSLLLQIASILIFHLYLLLTVFNYAQLVYKLTGLNHVFCGRIHPESISKVANKTVFRQQGCDCLNRHRHGKTRIKIWWYKPEFSKINIKLALGDSIGGGKILNQPPP